MTTTRILWCVIIAISVVFLIAVMALYLYIIHEDSYISEYECDLVGGTTIKYDGNITCDWDPEQIYGIYLDP